MGPERVYHGRQLYCIVYIRYEKVKNGKGQKCCGVGKWRKLAYRQGELGS